MAESDPLIPTPVPPPVAPPAVEAAGSAPITAAAAVHLFAVGRVTSPSTPVAWEPPTIGELQHALPQYEIRALIGRGGMGAVYRGMQRSLHREVAIKILPPEVMGGDPQFAVRFQREAQAMAQLTHPGIVTVHDAGETAEGLLYFVMEYIEGTDVQAMLAERGRLPAEEALPIVARVCEALEFAHESGFIHRDIKPANIMIERRGQVKVADFGLARTATEAGFGLTGSKFLIGTAEFVAPEAFRPGVELDRRADVYAVGVMLYQMLTGTLPRGRFELPSRCVAGLDERIDAIVDRAMQSNREWRYPSAHELRADIHRILGVAPGPSGLLVAAGHASSVAPPERARGKGRIWIAVAGIVGLTVGGVIWWVRSVGAAGAIARQAKAAAEENRQRWKPVPNKFTAPMDRGVTPVTASKEAPFVNTLDMKFVPVPITGGPTGGERVLFSLWETRVQDYEVFAQETQRAWPKPQFEQGRTHPVVKVNWDDAHAFCAWLTEREHKLGKLGAAQRYRLPSDHEWSCAVGIGEREDPALGPVKNSGKLADIFPWGTAWPPPPGAGNYSGEESAGHEKAPDQKILAGYRDDFAETAPVGSFAANALGLFDLGGNVWEWCEDRWKPGEPARVIRGASFGSASRSIASSYRDSSPPEAWNSSFGFRVVMTAASPAASPARQWAKVFPDLAKLPNLAEFKDGWARLSDRDAIKQLDDRGGQPLALRNGGVRAQRRVPPNWRGGILLHVRSQDHGRRLNLCYYEPKAPGEKAYLQLREYRPETLPPEATSEQAWAAQKLLAEQRIPPVGTEFATELVVVGNTLRGSLGPYVVTCAVEGGDKGGRVAIDEANALSFRDVEVLNLDNLTPAEALKVVGLAADLGAQPGLADPARRSGTAPNAPAARWRDAFAESPLKEVIAKAEHTAQGYRLPANNHWAISPRPQRAGAVRVRGTGRGEKFVNLYVAHEDRLVERVRFLSRTGDWLLSHGPLGSKEVDLTVTQGANPLDGQSHELLLARVGGRLRTMLDGHVLHDEGDPGSGPGTFFLDLYPESDLFVEKVEYLDLEGVPEVAARDLLSSEKK